MRSWCMWTCIQWRSPTWLVIPCGSFFWIINLRGGKRGKQAFECLEVDKAFEARKEKVNQKELDKTSKEFLAFFNTFWVFKVQARWDYIKAQWDHEAYEPHCERIGCHWRRPKWGFHQGHHHQGKVAKLLCREGDQDKESMAMVAPSWNIHGNKTPKKGQGVNSFHSNLFKGACVGLVML